MPGGSLGRTLSKSPAQCACSARIPPLPRGRPHVSVRSAGQQHPQHEPPAPTNTTPRTLTTGPRYRKHNTARATGRGGRQNALPRRSARRDARGTVQGPGKETATRRHVTRGTGGQGLRQCPRCSNGQTAPSVRAGHGGHRRPVAADAAAGVRVHPRHAGRRRGAPPASASAGGLGPHEVAEGVVCDAGGPPWATAALMRPLPLNSAIRLRDSPRVRGMMGRCLGPDTHQNKKKWKEDPPPCPNPPPLRPPSPSSNASGSLSRGPGKLFRVTVSSATRGSISA